MELRRVMANVTSLDSFLRVMSVARMTRLQEAVTNLNKREKGLLNNIIFKTNYVAYCPLMKMTIDHFRSTFSLILKASFGVHPFNENECHSHVKLTYFQMNYCAIGLALKDSLKTT